MEDSDSGDSFNSLDEILTNLKDCDVEIQNETTKQSPKIETQPSPFDIATEINKDELENKDITDSNDKIVTTNLESAAIVKENVITIIVNSEANLTDDNKKEAVPIVGDALTNDSDKDVVIVRLGENAEEKANVAVITKVLQDVVPTIDRKCVPEDLKTKDSISKDELITADSEIESFSKVLMRGVSISKESTKDSLRRISKAKLVEAKNEDIVVEATNQTLAAGFKDVSIIEQFLDNSQVEAEARLAARRAARAEAREIRMREVERQQREQEENADRQFDMQEPLSLSLTPTAQSGRATGTPVAMLRPGANVRLAPGSASYLSSRRSSEDSLEDTGNLRDLRHELKDVEEKFRKAMIANAQLDNDKASQTYQLELLKDRIEELEEEHAQLRREHRDKCRDHDQLQRATVRLQLDVAAFKLELEERDRLIADKGLVIVGCDDEVSEIGVGGGGGGGGMTEGGSGGMVNGVGGGKRALVSAENAAMLEHAGEGSLDVRLARFSKERSEFQDIISHLRLELEEERNRRRKTSGMLNGPSSDSDFDDQHRVASKQLDDYKFRAQKAEQDVATLQANVARLESQVIRYKSSSEASEKSEEALKTEKRKLQREARDALSRAEELETANTHLIKRLDKLKTAKSALLKEL